MYHTFTPGPQRSTLFVSAEQNLAGCATHPPVQVERRRFARRTPDQGAALEILGHAIEYLEDSNFHAHREGDPALTDALRILRESSRAVFYNRTEVPVGASRLLRWLGLGGNHAPVEAGARLVLVTRQQTSTENTATGGS